MKRVYLGIALMLLLPLTGLCITAGMHRICAPIALQLDRAAQLEDKTQAAALCSDAWTRWQHYRQLSAAVTDHEPMEEIDALFGTLEVYRRFDDSVHFSECCVQLASQVRAIADAQSANWWNIF